MPPRGSALPPLTVVALLARAFSPRSLTPHAHLARDATEAVRRSAESATALEAERAASAKARDEAAMYAARLKEAEKDVFKLERAVEEREKAFISYQASRAAASTHTRAQADVIRIARVCADDGGAAD